MAEDKNIHQRIHAIMKDVSYVQKENKKVNNQYTFVSHDAVTSKCRKAMVEHGVIALPTMAECKKEGNLTKVKVRTDFINIDNPEDKVSCECWGDGIDNGDKGIGKAYSYAYKYTLLKMFALETGDDNEKDLIDHEPTHVPTVKVSSSKAKQLWSEIEAEVSASEEVPQLEAIYKTNTDKINIIKNHWKDVDPSVFEVSFMGMFSKRKEELVQIGMQMAQEKESLEAASAV